jgi:hypothetical protein
MRLCSVRRDPHDMNPDQTRNPSFIRDLDNYYRHFMNNSHCDVFREAAAFLVKMNYKRELMMLLLIISSDVAFMYFGVHASFNSIRKLRRRAIHMNRAIEYVYWHAYGLTKECHYKVVYEPLYAEPVTIPQEADNVLVTRYTRVRASSPRNAVNLSPAYDIYDPNNHEYLCGDPVRTAKFLKRMTACYKEAAGWILKSFRDAQYW